MGPYQRTPKEVARAIRYSGLGVPSVGPVGDFLELLLQVIDERGKQLQGLPKATQKMTNSHLRTKKNLGDIRQKPTMKPLGSKCSKKNTREVWDIPRFYLKKKQSGQFMKQTNP